MVCPVWGCFSVRILVCRIRVCRILGLRRSGGGWFPILGCALCLGCGLFCLFRR